MSKDFNFEYKVLGNDSKLKEVKSKKILGIFTSRHATNYSKKIIKDIVLRFHDKYCFMMTFETFNRLNLDSSLGTFALIYGQEELKLHKKANYLKVFLNNEITELRLRYLYKDIFISNKSDSILILEATKYSKNLNILALYAQEIGKEVFVLPGRVDSDSSEGTNRLIFDGASPFYTLDLLNV
jgi:hypothetical protein